DDLLDFERDAVRLLRGRTGRQAYEHTHVAIVDLRQELVAEVARQQEDAGESSDRAAQHIPALGEHSGSIAGYQARIRAIMPSNAASGFHRCAPLWNRTFASWAASIGTSVSATISEAKIANEIVRISSRKMSAASPLIRRNGTTAARLVAVEAMTALRTSFAPTCAASSGSSIPSSRLRKMFSSITIELSIRRPTPRASPPSEMMLRVRLPSPIIRNVASIASGI